MAGAGWPPVAKTPDFFSPAGRRTLHPTDQDLFDRAYAYIKQYY